MKKGKRVAFILSMVLALTLVAGCSAKEEKNEDTGDKEKKELTVAGVVFQNDEFSKMMHQGMRDAAEDNNVKFLEGNSNDSVDKESELVNTYMSSGVDGIAINILDAETSVAALQKAYDKGLQIVVVNTKMNADFQASTVQSNQTALGETTGKNARKFIEEELNGEAKVGIIEFATLIPENSNSRCEGFESQLEGMEGVEIVSRQEAWTAEMALQKAQDMLTANPEINVIFGNCDPNTVGAVMAVKNEGRSGEVFVFGVDSSEQIANFLLDEDNILQATSAQQTYDIGYQSVDDLVKVLGGEKVEKDIVVDPIELSRTDENGVKDYIEMLRSYSE
ncbi:substrate-binding domain-containing protein [Extibacter sp. GGCC_0201]|uniref:substrate-binding domain-containing protein n=1 Tax=Extibacter sp. GGCC_0201 TaxID=2731209 RepID=UPI001AA12217|nr:substrate-binding domain-containing protein [Extibacter sp. GGCC_0201]MBO1721896.1 substrate-binding domain-containing protein [Extibacter sp. GGCC_0201]